MAVIQSGADGAVVAEVSAYSKALRVSPVPVGPAFSWGGVSGTIAATTNGTLFAMRLDPGATVRAYISRVVLQWTTIVAFTTPVTAGRRLLLTRAYGTGSPTGGTQITAVAKKDTSDPISECLAAQGGEMRISTTGALTVTGVTNEAADLGVMSLVDVGGAGAFKTMSFDWDAAGGAPVILLPGETLVVRTGAALDAAGTGQLGVTVDWFEFNPFA